MSASDWPVVVDPIWGCWTWTDEGRRFIETWLV